MQIEQLRIGFQEILSAYPTLFHFHEHYVKQGLLIGILSYITTVSQLKLRRSSSFWKQATEKNRWNTTQGNSTKVN